MLALLRSGLERVREAVQCQPAGNAWTGRLKPCDCHRSERYWGLGGHPPDCERVEDGAERQVRETPAAFVVEWKRTITWRCRGCGHEWTQHTGVTVERDVRWKEDEDGPPECPECETNERVREYEGQGGHTCDGCGMVFSAGGSGVTILGPRPEVVD